MIMPRHLHPDGLAEFQAHYGLGSACESCGSANLGVTVWDHYGTVPEDGSAEAKGGTGDLLAALVICQDCDAGTTLDRNRLTGARAAE
jgi:hypothetical protein